METTGSLLHFTDQNNSEAHSDKHSKLFIKILNAVTIINIILGSGSKHRNERAKMISLQWRQNITHSPENERAKRASVKFVSLSNSLRAYKSELLSGNTIGYYLSKFHKYKSYCIFGTLVFVATAFWFGIFQHFWFDIFGALIPALGPRP